jgi:hypothetical protein
MPTYEWLRIERSPILISMKSTTSIVWLARGCTVYCIRGKPSAILVHQWNEPKIDRSQGSDVNLCDSCLYPGDQRIAHSLINVHNLMHSCGRSTLHVWLAQRHHQPNSLQLKCYRAACDRRWRSPCIFRPSLKIGINWHDALLDANWIYSWAPGADKYNHDPG